MYLSCEKDQTKKVKGTAMMRSFVIFVLIVSLFGHTAFSADGMGSQPLIEGAKKEGQMVFYTSVETEFARALTAAFEAKYPFIKADIYRSTHAKILSRMNVERKTGTYIADAVSVGEFETYHLQKMGFITPYKSPSAAAYPEGFKDADGYWADLYDNLVVTAYNTSRVKRDELPKRYEDLLHPRWKGRMVFDENEDRWFANMLYLMGEKKGMELMQGLARQQIVIRAGRSMVTQLLGGRRVRPADRCLLVQAVPDEKTRGAGGLAQPGACTRGVAPDQHRQSRASSQWRETFHRFRALRGRSKNICATGQRIRKNRDEAGRLSRSPKGISQPSAAGRKAGRL